MGSVAQCGKKMTLTWVWSHNLQIWDTTSTRDVVVVPLQSLPSLILDILGFCWLWCHNLGHASRKWYGAYFLQAQVQMPVLSYSLAQMSSVSRRRWEIEGKQVPIFTNVCRVCFVVRCTSRCWTQYFCVPQTTVSKLVPFLRVPFNSNVPLCSFAIRFWDLTPLTLFPLFRFLKTERND